MIYIIKFPAIKSNLKKICFSQVSNAENKSDVHYAVTEENLPHIITSIEGKLGVSIHESPTIHLIVYIPPCDSSPLRLYNSKQRDAVNNGTIQSFLSSKWGGIIISNPTADECADWMSNQEKVEVTVNSHNVMHTALFLLRRIIDIHIDVSTRMFIFTSKEKVLIAKFGIFTAFGACDYDSKSSEWIFRFHFISFLWFIISFPFAKFQVPIASANIVPWEAITPRSWEVDSYLRISAIHLISSATSTLQSLIQLLGIVKNLAFVKISTTKKKKFSPFYSFILWHY